MFCTNCGKEFEGNFCPNCGTTVDGNNTKQDDEMLSAVNYLASAYDEIEILMNKHTEIEVKISNLEYRLEHPDINLNSQGAEKKSGDICTGLINLTLIVFTWGLYLIVLYFINKNKQKKIDSENKIIKDMKLKEYRNDIKKQISNKKSEKIILESEIYAIAETDSWIQAEFLIPKEIFKNSDIIYAIHNYIKFKRVDTWKEAYNLYLDESHKARMEELAIAQLDVAEQSLQIQKEICESTKELLNVSIQQRDAIFKMSESLQKQQEIMLEIRTTTNQTAKSARLAAFCTVIGLFK